MTYRACHRPTCGCPGPAYAGVVTIDTTSEPGSYARTIRHREQIDAVRVHHSHDREVPRG